MMNLVLTAALSIGFFGSFHCIGMCGPLALALPIHRQSLPRQLWSILVYNAGRITTYAALGALFGMLGKGFALMGWQQGISIGLGLLLLACALVPELLRKAGWHRYVFMPFNGLTNLLRRFLSSRNTWSLLLFGLLNGLLPCGLVYAGIAGAIATGYAAAGALFMTLFGAGTLPMMVLLPFLGQRISPGFRSGIRKAMPLLLSLTAVLLILRGLNLGIPYISPKINSQGEAACHGPSVAMPKVITCTKPDSHSCH